MNEKQQQQYNPKATVFPTIPVNADWEATTGLAEILNKPNISNSSVTSNVPLVFNMTSGVLTVTWTT